MPSSISLRFSLSHSSFLPSPVAKSSLKEPQHHKPISAILKKAVCGGIFLNFSSFSVSLIAGQLIHIFLLVFSAVFAQIPTHIHTHIC